MCHDIQYTYCIGVKEMGVTYDVKSYLNRDKWFHIQIVLNRVRIILCCCGITELLVPIHFYRLT